MENEKTRPVSEIKLGAIVASIWKNEGISGSYFNVTLSRLYKEGEAWKRSEISSAAVRNITVCPACNARYARFLMIIVFPSPLVPIMIKLRCS